MATAHGKVPARYRALACVAVALAAACSAGRRPPVVDLSSAGWVTRTGQAVWQREVGAAGLAGDVLLAARPGGDDLLVDFSKPPISIFTARVAAGGWWIDFVERGRSYSGGGSPPVKRFVWFALPAVIAGEPAPRPWRVVQPSDDEWLLTHEKTGESVRLLLDPAGDPAR